MKKPYHIVLRILKKSWEFLIKHGYVEDFAKLCIKLIFVMIIFRISGQVVW